MNEPPIAPIPYTVVYSEVARIALRDFATRARRAGNGERAAAILTEIDRRLRIYPQFGEPLIDLTQEPGQVWLGTVPPITLRYAIYEERRLVIVALVRILTNADG